MVKKLWAKFRKPVIDFINDINNSLGSTLGAEKKFVKWAEDNHFQIETLEFSSFLEAGFSYWQVRRGNSCVKAILVDKQQNRKGVYLMTAFGHDMKVKFVPADEIKFKNPVINHDQEE